MQHKVIKLRTTLILNPGDYPGLRISELIEQTRIFTRAYLTGRGLTTPGNQVIIAQDELPDDSTLGAQPAAETIPPWPNGRPRFAATRDSISGGVR